MNLTSLFTLTFLYCVPIQTQAPFIMAGFAHREDPLDVFNHLQHNLIWLSMPSGLTMDLAINILGKYKKYCRTGYWFSKTTVFLEIVGKGTAVIDKIIALTGLQEIGGMARHCYIEQASKRIDPQLISEYAYLLVSGEARLMHLTSKSNIFQFSMGRKSK